MCEAGSLLIVCVCASTLHFCPPNCVQQISYISLRLPVSPPLTAKCARNYREEGAGGREATRRGEWHHLATCSRFTPDLHFGSVRCALQEATPGQEQLDLARLGAGFSATSQAEKEKEQAQAEEEEEAFSRSSSNEGALVASG